MKLKMNQKSKGKRIPKSASSQFHQITLRGLDPRLVGELQRLAKTEGISLNKAALRLLKKGAGMTDQNHRLLIGKALDPWIGTWSDEEARQFLDSIRSCEQIDKEYWA